jgi:hypothetical protein
MMLIVLMSGLLVPWVVLALSKWYDPLYPVDHRSRF